MWHRAAISGVLVALTAAVYLQVRAHEFVDKDDPLYIVDNPQVHAGLGVDTVLAAFTQPRHGNWIPLTWISLSLDHDLYGLEPAGYHLTNVALHALAAVLLFLALARMSGADAPSAFVAAVFAIHPLHVESVAWASERKDVLVGVFWMLTLLLYARYAAAPGPARYAAVMVSFFLAIISKPVAVTLPFALLLLDYWPLRRLRADGGTGLPELAPLRRAAIEKLPLLALSTLASVITFAVQRAAGAMGSAGQSIPLSMRVSNALESFLVYLKMAIWPVGLATFYPHPLERATLARGAVAGALLLAITGLALRFARSGPYAIVGWLWYLGTLVPVVGIVQVGMQARADRYMYLPLVGLSLAAAWGAVDLAERSRARMRALAAVAAGAVLALAWGSWLQVAHWRDTIALHTRAAEVVEGNFLAHQRLAVAYQKEGRMAESRAHFEESIRIEPRRAAVHFGLANLLVAEGDLEGALAHYEDGLALDPDHPQARRALGLTAARLGRLAAARRELARAAALLPGAVDVRMALAQVCQQLGLDGEAIDVYREALRLEPGWTPGVNNLAWILATSADPSLRDPAEAIALAERISRGGAAEKPAWLDTLAAAYAAAGRFDEAMTVAKRGLAIAVERDDAASAESLSRNLARYEQGRPARP